MTIQTILKKEKERIRPDKKLLEEFKAITNSFTQTLERELARAKIGAEVVVGGSFAKGTLVKKEVYDIDILVRCDWRYDDLTALIEKPLQKASSGLGMRFEKVHGSRDYFRIVPSGRTDLVIEIIPVTRIKKVHEERNVTDLSYFHVAYVRKAGKNLEDDIRLAKQFCAAQGVYGAESYIQGFSGYALECLVIHYGSFVKMLKALVKMKEREIIDTAKHYKKKREVLITINESKLKSPLILIDPTYKERNALAALSKEQFTRFQKAAKAFLAKPSEKFFITQQASAEQFRALAKKQKSEFAELTLETGRQPGDIAGTKLKKFSHYLERELSEYFNLQTSHFEYDGLQKATLFVVAKPKKEHIRIGPPVNMKDAVKAFKGAHLKTFVKNGLVHARSEITFTLASYLHQLVLDKKKLVEMSITRGSVKH